MNDLDKHAGEILGGGKPHSLEVVAGQILLAAFLFWALERSLSLGAIKTWIQQRFKAAGKVESKDIDDVFWQSACRIVGMAHLIIQIPLALLVIFDASFQSDPIHATTSLSFIVTIISAGYFCYDLYVCIFRWEGAAYLLHGATCSTLYCYCAFSGFIHYYAALFLLWELSTPFVYLRWFLYNLNMAGSKLYMCNGLAMLLSFFWARNVMGAFMLVNFFKTTENELQNPKGDGNVMGAPMIWIYRVACVALTCLNAMWFFKMFKGALKVFTSSPSNSKETAERVERSQTAGS